MFIAILNARLAEQKQPTEPPVNQASYAELDELAVPEFSRLYMPTPDSHLYDLTTIISKPQ